MPNMPDINKRTRGVQLPLELWARLRKEASKRAMSKPYHIFIDEELEGLEPEELKQYLTGKVMTCSKCCAARVCLHAWKWEGYQYYSISCGGRYGGDGCKHNIAGNSLAEVINDWNAEIDGELEECGVEALDFSDEVCII